MKLSICLQSWIFKSFSDAAADATSAHKIVILWVILGPLQNHRHRSFSASGDYLVIPYVFLENDLKIYVFLAVASEVAAALASAVTSLKDSKIQLSITV